MPKDRVMGDREGFVADIWATHPPIQSRIDALKVTAGPKSDEVETAVLTGGEPMLLPEPAVSSSSNS